MSGTSVCMKTKAPGQGGVAVEGVRADVEVRILRFIHP